MTIRHLDGRDVRGDRQQIPTYRYERALKGSANVKHWREARFLPHYPGFLVDVLRADGQAAHGSTLLSTLRDV